MYFAEYEDAKPIFRKAIESGINFFDTANVYQLGSSETITDKLIREFGLNRDEIVVATKVNFEMRAGRPNGGGSSRKNIMAVPVRAGLVPEIDHSLERLGLDYVDLYQIHRLDAFTPMEEILEALHDVVKSGKARYIGACTMDAWQFERMQNLAERTRTKIDAVSPAVWTEKTAAQDKEVVDNLERVAREHGRTMAQESLAWMLSKPFICSPVVGTTSVKHVEEAVSAVDIEITPEEVAALEAPYTAHTKQHAF